MEPGLSNKEKAATIRKWINPEERVTVHFDDQRNLNAEVTGCTDQLVFLSLETTVPHMRQQISMPLSNVALGKDFFHYTRDPGRPLARERLMLIIRGNRPAVVM